MPGPLPNPQRRRTNAPTIPTTNLPAGGRHAPAPKVPRWVKLGKSGRAWWAWAWRTPQAAAWAAGHEVFVARRASLEDDLSALEDIRGLDFDVLLGASASEARQAVARVAALATSRLSVLKEMRELDDRLGLSPKGMAALRWQVVADAPDVAGRDHGGNVVAPDRWQRMGA